MELSIKAIHFDITEKLTAFVNKKVEKFCRRNDMVSDIDVNLRLIKPETAMNKEAGIRVIVADAPEFYASKTADTFEEAVDLALAALEPQLEKFKSRK